MRGPRCYNPRMGYPPLSHQAHRCSFSPDRRDLYLRLGTLTVFVRDQDRSLRFYLDQLGFSLVFDGVSPSGARSVVVRPPDGTASLMLLSPEPSEYSLVGRATHAVFMTENALAQFHEWRERGVRFHYPPRVEPGGSMSATFEDPDGNSFMLLGLDVVAQEVAERRREHAVRREAEERAVYELQLARDVQARLFPQSLPPLRTLDYAGLCLQARQVGGDYYDFLDLGRERLGLVTGDISGKGTAAALLMSNLQAHLHNLSAAYSSRPYTPFALEQPQRFLTAVNRLFYENSPADSFATVFFAEYDDNTGRLRYANCGHPSALLIRGDGDVARLEPTCTVLGLFPDWDCAAGECQVLPGDMLALYTDGVIESFNEAGEEFGEHRLLETLRRHREQPSHALLASTVDEVRRFSPHEQHDDITLIVARCRENA